jgi:ligand-binding sensor domain-containing protein/signal transduction histidine kinase
MILNASAARRVPRLGRLIVLLTVLVVWVSQADDFLPIDRDFQVRVWRQEHGLPENKVLSLLVDRSGFLWIGTRAGLARFDGQQFKIWSRSTEPAFADETCQALAEDAQGNIWVGTREGLVRLGTNPTRLRLTNLVTRASVTSRSLARLVTCLLVTRHNEVFAGTESGLFADSARGEWRLVEIPGAPDDLLTLCLAESTDGSIWLGTSTQLYRRRADDSAWEPQLSNSSLGQCVWAMTLGREDRPVLIQGSYRPGDRWLSGPSATGWDPLPATPIRGWARPMFLFGDGEGGIWLPSDGHALARWESGEMTVYDWTPAIGIDAVSCMAQDRNGHLWVGLTRGGLVGLEPRRVRHLASQDGLPHENTWALLQTRDGALWVGTDGGVARFAESRLFRSEQIRDHGPALGGASVIASRAAGWRRESGVGSAGTPRPTFGPTAVDRQVGRLVLDEPSLSSRLRRWGERTREPSLGSGPCLWGVIASRAETRNSETAPSAIAPQPPGAQLPENPITVLNEANGLSRNQVRALAEDAAGRVWIGTTAGLNVWNGERLESVALGGEWFRAKVRCLLATTDGAMWVGSAQGLHRIHAGETNSWYAPDVLPHDDMRALLEDHQGRLWIGTDGGGLAKHESGTFERYGLEQGLCSLRVWALCEDEDGRLWIGTDRGLGCLTQGRFSAVTTEHGLPVNLVNGIVDDLRGFLWIGHDAGIYRVRRVELIEVIDGRRTSVHCVAYDQEDGLLSLETNGQKSYPPGLRLRDGRIAFATTAGVTLFNPTKPPDLTNAPVVRIEMLTVGGRRLFSDAPGAELLLRDPGRLVARPSLGRQVEIQFNAAAYRQRAKTRFEYRLLGSDPSWYPARSLRNIAYPLLKPGDYRFEVRAWNAHGYPSLEPARLSFRLEPRPFERTSVRLGLALLAAAIIYLLARWRLKEMRRIHRLEYEAGIERERSRLARDLHDGLGSSLSEINLIGGQLAGSRPASDTLTTAGVHPGEKVRQRSAEAMASLRELIWATNPKADTLESLAAWTCDQAEHMARAAGLRCRFDVPLDYPAVTVRPAFRREVALAVGEAVNNVIRHARARELQIQIELADQTLSIRVLDDGQGFEVGTAQHPSPTHHRGLGLTSMMERIRELGGRCEINRRPSQGTEVAFHLPLTRAAEHSVQ